MPRQKHSDFYKRLTQLEKLYLTRLRAEEAATRALFAAGLAAAQDAALARYRRAVAAVHNIRTRRDKFLDQYGP